MLKKILIYITILASSFVANKALSSPAISPKQAAMAGFSDIVDSVLPAVVSISITSSGSSREFGSGFIISKDGLIVTNNHVIDEASDITVTLNNEQKFKAKIISLDKKTDIALLKIDSDNDFKFIKFGDSTRTKIGDWVLVAGNPYGLGLSVSSGIISAKGRSPNSSKLDEFIQTDAAINNGNSGGPMINMSGEVIGISTSIISPSGGNIGIGFAVPSSIAEPIINQLKDQGEVIRGWIGISVQNVNNEIAESFGVERNRGAFVTEISKDGPADQSGIIPTDVILKIDDTEINDMKILPKIISNYAVGKTAKITISRRGTIKIMNVKIAKMQDDDNSRKIDLSFSERKPQLRSSDQILGIGITGLNSVIKKIKNIDASTNGVLVTEVNPKSEASSKGLISGDIIMSINQEMVSSTEKIKSIVEDAAKNNKKLFLLVKRGANSLGIALTASAAK